MEDKKIQEIYADIKEAIELQEKNKIDIAELIKQRKEAIDIGFDFNNKMGIMDKDSIEYTMEQRQKEENDAKIDELQEKEEKLRGEVGKKIGAIRKELSQIIADKTKEMEDLEKVYRVNAQNKLKALEETMKQIPNMSDDMRKVYEEEVQLAKEGIKNIENKSMKIYKEINELKETEGKLTFDSIIALKEKVADIEVPELVEEPTEELEPVEELEVEEEFVKEPEPVEESEVEEEFVKEPEPVKKSEIEEKFIKEPESIKQSAPKPEKLSIIISAQENAVTINGKVLPNLNIQEILENRKATFKRIDIKQMIKGELETKNPFKVASVLRKVDPVIIAALQQSKDGKAERMIKDYIWSLNEKDMQFDYENGGKNFDITYDLRNSILEKSIDRQMQKYGRYADKVDGIEVEGLKERGPKAWFKSFMDRVKRPKLEKGNVELETEENSKGFKKMSEEATRLKNENEKSLREDLKYRQGTMDRFVQSYEEASQEPEFDLKTFMRQAKSELSSAEFTELGRVVNGEKENGGFKAMDQKAQKLKAENDNELESKEEEDEYAEWR